MDYNKIDNKKGQLNFKKGDNLFTFQYQVLPMLNAKTKKMINYLTERIAGLEAALKI